MKLTVLHHNVRNWTNNTNINISSNYYLQNSPDIITLNSHSITEQGKNIKLFNYTGYTKNRTQHAGVAILVKSGIPHTFHTKTTNQNIMAVTISTNKGQVTIVTFYRAPRDDFLPLSDLQTFLNFGNPTLITTDANIKHTIFDHSKTDKLGKLLFQFCQYKDLYYMGPSFHTYYSGTHKGKPDILLCNKSFLLLAHKIEEGKRLISSDHIPIHCTFSTNPILVPAPPKFNYDKADWPAFNRQMDQVKLPNMINKNSAYIDTKWQELIDNIQNAANLFIPKNNYRIIPVFNLSTKTKNLQIIYNQRHNLYKQNITNEQKEILDTIKQHIINSAKTDINNYWLTKLKEIEEFKHLNDPKNMYKNIKMMVGKNKINQGISLIDENGKEIQDPQQQANLFASTWKNIMSQNKPREDQDIKEHVEGIEMWRMRNMSKILPKLTINMNRLDKNTPLIAPVKVRETIYFMNKIKSQAAGPSGITPTIIKHTPYSTAVHITRLINATICTGYFPQILKKGNIFLIPKDLKKLHDPTKYRPITLLETFSKLIERIISNRLKNHIEGRQVNPNQFGFRPNKCTENIIFLAAYYLDLYTLKNKKTASVSLDITKAFDKVWHSGLIYKLFTQYQLPELTKILLTHFLIGRQYQITHRNKLSFTFTSSAGVPQGSVLSPTLFIMYTNDTPSPLNNTTLTMHYADDITTLIQAPTFTCLNKRIAKEITHLDHYQAMWLIQTNKTKSKIVLYKQHANKVKQYEPIKINNETIPFAPSTNILGVTFDNQLNFKKHINHKYKLANNTLNKLKKFTSLHPKLQYQIFQTLSLSQIMYSTTPLIHPLQYGIKKVQTLQNKALRQIYQISWTLRKTNVQIHIENNIPFLEEKIHAKFMKNYYTLLNQNNHILNNLERNTDRDTTFTIRMANPPDTIEEV